MQALLRRLASDAARVVPGEAWRVYTFLSHRTAERWANWIILCRLVPDGCHLDVRGSGLYVVRPEGRRAHH